MATLDRNRIKTMPSPTPEALHLMWSDQLRRVPPSLLYHISQSADIDPNVALRFEAIGVTGAFEATRTMVFADNALKMCRAGYEATQGQADFGWNQNIPNWEPPYIQVTDVIGNSIRYDGQHSLAHSEAVAWVNSGSLDLDKITNLGSDDSMFIANEDTPDRRGGIGQGAKIMLTTFIASKQDRINALELYREKRGFSLNRMEIETIEQAIKDLQLSLETEGESDAFATVQAKDSQGHYYRAYCFRETVRYNGRDMWKLRYIVAALDETQVAESEKDKVIFAVHNPDIPLAKVLDGMKDNLLEVDPYYPDKHSLVRDSDSTLPQVKIQETVCQLVEDRGSIFEKTLNDSDITVERIDRSGCGDPDSQVEGKVYFRGTSMISEAEPTIGLIFSYHIKSVAPEVKHLVARTPNSTFITGPITDIISQAAAEINDPKDWIKILDLSDTLVREGLPASMYPELNPIINKDKKISEAVSESLRHAFEYKYPGAKQMLASSQRELDSYRELTGDMSPIPVVTSDKLVSFLNTSGIKDVKNIVSEYIEKKLLITHFTGRLEVIPKEKVDDIIRQSEQYRRYMGMDKMSLANFINAGFSESGVFKFINHGRSYDIEVVDGQHVLQFKFGASNAPGSMLESLSNISRGSSFNLEQDALLIAAIDSGIDISFIYKRFSGNQTIARLQVNPSGNLCIMSGHPLRDDNRDYGFINITGNFTELTRLRSQLDNSLGKTSPSLISNRTKSEFSNALFLLNSTLKRLAPGEEVTEATVEKLQKILETAQKAQDRADASLDKLRGERRKATSNNGVINGAQITGILPGGGCIDGIYREGVMLGRSSHSCNTLIRSRGRQEKGPASENEKISFGGNDYKCIWYGDKKHDDLYLLEAYENLEYAQGGMRRTNEINELVPAESEDNDPWRIYTPSSGPNYISRTTGSITNYDGFLEFHRELLPVNYEAVLPIDTKKYKIAYIQFPVEAGSDTPLPPLLMEDLVNNQFSLHFSDAQNSDVLKSLPKGTRIYLKEKTVSEQTPQVSHERLLIENHPEYLKKTTESLIDINKLDTEAREFVSFLKNHQPPLTRLQSMTALHHFWESRRLYDDEGVYCDTIEQLAIRGVGVCDESEAVMTHLPRLLGIPSRSRVAYSDSDRAGNLSPPLHMVTEFLNDQGFWEVWDPPNRRTTPQFKEKLARAAVDGKVPEVMDSRSLGRGKIRNIAQLPTDVTDRIAALIPNQGDEITPEVASILSATLSGQEVSPEALINAIIAGEPEISRGVRLDPTEKQVAAIIKAMEDNRQKLEQLQLKYGIDSKEVEKFKFILAQKLAYLLISES